MEVPLIVLIKFAKITDLQYVLRQTKFEKCSQSHFNEMYQSQACIRSWQRLESVCGTQWQGFNALIGKLGIFSSSTGTGGNSFLRQGVVAASTKLSQHVFHDRPVVDTHMYVHVLVSLTRAFCITSLNCLSSCLPPALLYCTSTSARVLLHKYILLQEYCCTNLI